LSSLPFLGLRRRQQIKPDLLNQVRDRETVHQLVRSATELATQADQIPPFMVEL